LIGTKITPVFTHARNRSIISTQFADTHTAGRREGIPLNQKLNQTIAAGIDLAEGERRTLILQGNLILRPRNAIEQLRKIHSARIVSLTQLHATPVFAHLYQQSSPEAGMTSSHNALAVDLDRPPLALYGSHPH